MRLGVAAKPQLPEPAGRYALEEDCSPIVSLLVDDCNVVRFLPTAQEPQ